MSGVLNDCDALLQAAPVRIIANGLSAQVQEALDAADAAQANADAALVKLADIESDGKLSPGEKPAAVAARDAIIAEQGGIEASATALGVTTEKTAYTAAITALTTYLASAPLTGWNAIPGTTIDITGTEFRSKFNAVYAARQTLLNSIVSASVRLEFAATRIWEFATTAEGWTIDSATAVITQGVSSIIVDSSGNDPRLLSPTGLGLAGAQNDKIRMRVRRTAGTKWDGTLFYATSAGPNALHNMVGTHYKKIPDTTLSGAWVTLEWDMANLTVGGTDYTASTIGQLRFDLGADAADTFEIDWISIGKTAPGVSSADFAALQQTINNIASDNLLSAGGEKSAAIGQWQVIYDERAPLIAQAASLGVSTASYTADYNALSAYLGGLTGFSNVATDSVIDGPTFRTLFSNYYTEKETLRNAMDAAAATRATWSTVSGSGKPADNASADLILVPDANISVIGNRATKVGGTANWDAQVQSKEGFVGGAYVTARADVLASIMFGLNRDPGTDANYTSIDYAMFLRLDGGISAYENGVDMGTIGTYAPGDMFSVVYDGSSVRYSKNGGVMRTAGVAAQIVVPLYFDSSFYHLNSSLSNIRFGPLSSNNWALVGGTGRPEDGATKGAPAGTLVAGVDAATVASNAANAVQAPTFSVTGTFGGTVTDNNTGLVTLSKTLSVSVSGNVNPVTITWSAVNLDSNLIFRMSSTSGTSTTVSATAQNNQISVGITCTVTDTVSGVSIVRNGTVNLRMGAL